MADMELRGHQTIMGTSFKYKVCRPIVGLYSQTADISDRISDNFVKATGTEETEHAGSCKLNNLLAELMLYYLQVYLY